jgi:hypothetical protein
MRRWSFQWASCSKVLLMWTWYRTGPGQGNTAHKRPRFRWWPGGLGFRSLLSHTFLLAPDELLPPEGEKELATPPLPYRHHKSLQGCGPPAWPHKKGWKLRPYSLIISRPQVHPLLELSNQLLEMKWRCVAGHSVCVVERVYRVL